ncbi:MAG: 3-dehydroquinate synthase [Candidatus Omnitrophica bacterium]|nr:3-dehydroquinate synthase [Candidatus Omnitrophota bacterium]MCB9783273.1 3-dehydroquinate synthase [Candidatus Omnitrophota bacterium]
MTANLSEIVRVDLGDRSYDIEIGVALWPRLAESLVENFHPKRAIVITDSNVGPLYEPKLEEAFRPSGIELSYHQMSAGEEHKNLDTVQTLYDEILSRGCDRKTPVIAMGGGVPGDTGGFVAATLLRGVPYIQVPTSLLAMVDSSVGGKTGVDTPHGKNLIGAFYQPALVSVSIDTLETLPKREVCAGLAEVIKYGVIWDAKLFEELESGIEKLVEGDRDSFIRIVKRCCEIKAEVVSKDEFESGLRAILNYGHTVGHAIEAATEYGEYLHGEGISVGMVVETEIAELLGRDLGDLKPRLKDLFQRANLPVTPPEHVEPARIWELMHSDKKTLGGDIRMVLPSELGNVDLVPGITRKVFEKAWGNCG